LDLAEINDFEERYDHIIERAKGLTQNNLPKNS
jgi:hypothetical protein